MKKTCIFFAIAFFGEAAFAQTLITYGNNTVSKDEFLRAYNKNKPVTNDKQKSIKDYLELYTNFKLKVKAAEELRLDTVSQIKYDIQNFRDQIIDNYLNDETGMQLLTNEAIARAAKDVHVLYFSVPVSSTALPADTMKAYNAAKELYNSLKKGTTDYAATVTEVSSKFFPAKYSDVGFITAFSVKYEFENIIYNTKPGNVSMPYRSAKGWSIFKVTEERPDAGKWKVAQLLFAYPPDADYNAKLAVKQKADSLYGLLQKGLLFADAAKLYSEDRTTYLTGGEMPEFGTGKYTSVFEQNAFNLKNNNDFSRPFETSYGYHIIKRISRVPVPTDKNDAAYKAEIKQKIVQDVRINNLKEKFAKDIAVQTGYRKLPGVSDAEFFRYADSIKKNSATANIAGYPISKKAIIKFKDGTQLKGDEWLSFVKEYNANPEQEKISDKNLWDKFAAQAVINYYKNHLEDYNSEFKYQMQEFKEGNMLFEIMERNVWSKAGADSAGLVKYYNTQKENYKWGASADVLIFNCADEKAAAEARDSLAAGKTWMSVAENSNNKVQADSGRYELSQIPGAEAGTTPRAGSYSPVIKNADGTVVLINYLKVYEPNMQRSFAEARGLVISDYQNILEKRWVDSLRKKYPVQVNEAVVKQILN